VEDLVWVETLKDELRDESKALKPRTFRCCTISMQILTKQCFGRFVEHIIKTRNRHGICVGINPLVEFPILHAQLQQCAKLWALDFGEWDGSMPTQIQHDIADILSEFASEGDHRTLVEFLSHNMAHSVVLIMDDLFQTTHSMPSGSFLTAIVNSLVNKYLTAAWYAKCCEDKGIQPSILQFESVIVDYVYGDDKLCGSRSPIYDASSMAAYFRSLGFIVTDDKKNSDIQSSYSLSEVTFLKRNLVYSGRLHRIVCPLARATLYSSLSWYDETKDHDVVLQDKINAFQREAYLHDDYEALMSQLLLGLKERNIRYEPLTEKQLDLYLLSGDPQFLKGVYDTPQLYK